MKFVRIFALLIALAGAVNGLQSIVGLYVAGGYGVEEAIKLHLAEVVGALVFGYGAYVLTNREA